MNVIIAKQKFLSSLIYLSFSKFSYISSEYVLKQKFKLKYAQKYTIFIEKL